MTRSTPLNTPLNTALFLFAMFLIFGFGADYVTGAAQHGVIVLALASLVGAVLAAGEAWDTRKG